MPHDKRTHSTAPSVITPIGPVRIHPVDYRAAQDAADMRAMLDLYARDPMGGGEALDADVLGRLCGDLAARADAFSFLAYVDAPQMQALLGAAHDLARARGCCKLTLEVLSGNAVAMRSYLRSGFANYQLDPAAGQAVLMQKWL